MREKVILICENCLSRNYRISKNATEQKEKISLKKYCKKCGKHTIHKESR